MTTPGTDLTFRRLHAGDAQAMFRLEKCCFSQPWTEEQCRAAFLQPAFAAFGLLEPAGLVAYISFYHSADELEILNIAVTPGRRRQGLGRRVLGMALQVAGKMGIKKSLLEVRESNLPAIGLYESFDFRPVGRRRNYYRAPDEDALIYERLAKA
ncbi:ribosomal protein S18-alanine N-acetyltransferase [uncultured Desulfovibrio sp.]|uniref:ribosomal protein S18-alanine N-acetyltransferase n=1 Tax=uncultured Desulfovibrio sp. TaxID=167968 RepID=UPI0025F32DA8|nr:ribosomal protein S18-alanine N-acetyltransferase [uncultured Desulfovibrio sp.]